MKRLCMLHGKEVCKECNGCEDCGIRACIHTKRGLITKSIFEGIKIGSNNRPTDQMVEDGIELIEKIICKG